MGLVGTGGPVARVHPQTGPLETLDVTQAIGELLMSVFRLHAVTCRKMERNTMGYQNENEPKHDFGKDNLQ